MDVWSSSYDQLRSFHLELILCVVTASVLELLALNNAASRTSQRLKWLSEARIMIIFGRAIARSLSRSVARSLGRALARTLDRSVARSLAHSIAPSTGRSAYFLSRLNSSFLFCQIFPLSFFFSFCCCSMVLAYWFDFQLMLFWFRLICLISTYLFLIWLI